MPSASSTPSPASFRVQILGPFAVERAGTPLDMTRWQRRITSLFKLLVVAPHHRRTRDELLDILWPDATEEAGGANLRLVLYRLRHALMAGVAPGADRSSPIIFEQGWVALNPAYTWDVDLDRFTEIAASAGDDLARLEEAAALYRGEALEDEMYEDWAAPYREHISRQWRQVCLHLAVLHRARGSGERAVEWLDRLLEADPLDEEVLRELLVTLEALTRETEALRRFQRFERRLAEELDVPPDAETLAVATRVAEHLRQTEVSIPPPPRTSEPKAAPVIPSYALSTVVPLIGRRQELQLISEMLADDAWTVPRILLLTAEAGEGKTRILAEAAARAREAGMLTLAGGSYEQEGHLPYGSIHDALLDYVLTQPEELLETRLDGLLPELTRVVPELRLRVTSATPDWGGDADGLRLRLFSAVAQALVHIAIDAPLLLLLDDLHWADDITLQLLHFLLRQPQLSRLLVIATYRREEVGIETPLAQWLAALEEGESAVRTHALGSLTAAEMGGLLEERLRGPCSETLSGALYERSGGNPFFALQMLRLLQQESRLELSVGGWRLKEAGGTGARTESLLPSKVRKTVARRLRTLSRLEHDSLAIGAVLGREFSYASIEAVWTGAQNDLFAALEATVNAYLLAETETGFTFRHPILREVVYEGIPRHRRIDLHRRAAYHLQSLYGPPNASCEPQHAVQLAWHFLQGQEPRQALGYALLAGDQAQAAFAHRRAEAHYRTALELARRLDDGPAERLALEQLGSALTALGRYDEAERVLEEADTAYGEENDVEGQRRVVAQIGQLHLKTGALERGIDRVTGALQTLESDQPSSGLGALYLAFASLSFRTGRYREQRRAAERAIEIAGDLGDTALLVQARLLRAYSLPWLGRVAEFRQALEEVVASAEEIGDLPTLTRALCALASPYSVMGEFDRAREALDRAMEIAERIGDPSRIAFIASACGTASYTRGEWAEAERLFSRALAIYRELNARSDTMIPLFGLGAVAMGRGDWERGAAALEEHIELARETGDFRWLHSAQALLGERDLLAGRPEEALARIEQVLLLPDLSAAGRAALLPALAQAQLELGKLDLAITTAIEAAARARDEDDREALIEALWVHGMALARRGRFSDAERRYERALQLLEQTPYPYIHGRVLLSLGLMLADRSETEPARARVQEALAIFQRLGAGPCIEKADRALATLAPSRATTGEATHHASAS